MKTKKEGIDQNYFKDKIDWKFLNYLRDRATEFEDNGGFIAFSIRTKYDHHKNPNGFLIYSNGTNREIFYDVIEEKIKSYLEHGLVYSLKFFTEKDTNLRKKDCETANKFAKKIHNKCNIIGLTGPLITVTPK